MCTVHLTEEKRTSANGCITGPFVVVAPAFSATPIGTNKSCICRMCAFAQRNSTAVCWCASVIFVAMIMAVVVVDVSLEDNSKHGTGESPVPYFVMHTFVAFAIFFGAAGVYDLLVNRWKCAHATWLCGLLASLPYYISREIRDAEKVAFPSDACAALDPPGQCFYGPGELDIAGLLWPTIGVIVLYAVMAGIEACWRNQNEIINCKHTYLLMIKISAAHSMH